MPILKCPTCQSKSYIRFYPSDPTKRYSLKWVCNECKSKIDLVYCPVEHTIQHSRELSNDILSAACDIYEFRMEQQLEFDNSSLHNQEIFEIIQKYGIRKLWNKEEGIYDYMPDSDC